MDNSTIKAAKALYSSDEYQAYLQLEFTKEGKETLKQISNEYKAVTNDEGEETTTYVSIVLDDTTLLTTYFGSEISDGILQISIGNSIEDYDTYKETAESLENIVDIINLGKMPVKYTLNSDNFIQSSITDKEMNTAKIVFGIVIVIISLYLILRYKLKGFLAAILAIGYIGLVTLALRYTNVYITINSIIAFISIVIINYVYMIKMLYNMKNNQSSNEAFLGIIKELYLTILPICIIAVIFTFMANTTISSIGMVLFWGLIVQAVYNTIFTRTIYSIQEK